MTSTSVYFYAKSQREKIYSFVMSSFPKSFVQQEIKIVQVKINDLESSLAYQRKMRLISERNYLNSLLISLNQQNK